MANKEDRSSGTVLHDLFSGNLPDPNASALLPQLQSDHMRPRRHRMRRLISRYGAQFLKSMINSRTSLSLLEGGRRSKVVCVTGVQLDTERNTRNTNSIQDYDNGIKRVGSQPGGLMLC